MLTSLLTFVVVVVSVYVLLYWKHAACLKRYKGIPGIRPLIFFGNIFGSMKLYSKKLTHHPGVYILQGIQGGSYLFRKEGLQIVWLGTFPIVAVFKPELLEVILSSSTSLDKSYEYSYLHKWLGRGLLTSSGAKWKSRRKLLTPSFHFRILEDFLPTFNEVSQVLVKKLEVLRDEDYVDITPLVVLCTLDVVCETVMGVSINAQTGENPEYVTAVHNLGDLLVERITRPLLWTDFMFNLSGTGRQFNRDLETLHNFSMKVIRDKKASMLSGGDRNGKKEEDQIGNKKRQALMDLLLDIHINGQQITEQDIQEEVDTFIFEGHDTTAMAITFTLYCIGLYPDVQRKIHEELDSILESDFQRSITIDDVRNMKYLECTIKESLRVYPSVPLIGRILNEDIKYKDSIIPKGSTVNLLIMSLHKNPYVFPEPEVFDPDRFSPENVWERHPFAYLPFSAGPRNCIGQKFALLEEKVIISNILRNFTTVSLDPRDKVQLKMEFVLRPAQPIRMKFIPR